jgi:hypothetical protein
VRLDGTRLAISVRGLSDLTAPLQPVARDVFVAQGIGLPVEFQRDRSGRIVRLSLSPDLLRPLAFDRVERLPRRRGQFLRAKESVVVRVLHAEAFGEARAMFAARQRGAAAAGLLGSRQHAVVVAIHRVEGVAEPVLVFDQRDAAVVVHVHAREVIAAGGHLRERRHRGEYKKGDGGN